MPGEPQFAQFNSLLEENCVCVSKFANLARAIIKNPILFCVEDNSTEIDLRTTECILAAINQNVTSFITTNDPNVIKLVNRVAILENG